MDGLSLTARNVEAGDLLTTRLVDKPVPTLIKPGKIFPLWQGPKIMDWLCQVD